MSFEGWYDENGPAEEPDPMLEALTRVAKDLERVLLVLVTSAGLLGLIAGLMLYRLLIGR